MRSTNFYVLCAMQKLYIGLTTRHLFQRIEEHCRSSSSICRHFQSYISWLSQEFCSSEEMPRKMDCLVYEMLLVKKYRPSLNIQSDSIHAKVFTWLWVFLCEITGWSTGLEQYTVVFGLVSSTYLCKFSSFSW